jgi:hypothetical protein
VGDLTPQVVRIQLLVVDVATPQVGFAQQLVGVVSIVPFWEMQQSREV